MEPESFIKVLKLRVIASHISTASSESAPETSISPEGIHSPIVTVDETSAA